MPAILNTVAMTAPGTWDGFNRILNYIGQAERQASELLQQMLNNPHDHRRLAEDAVAIRNQLLNVIRAKSTPFARAFSEALKEEGKTFAELLDLYSARVQIRPAQLIAPIDRFRAAARAVTEHSHTLIGAPPGHPAWTGARISYLREIMRAAGTNFSPKVSEHIIRASGRTNLTVNRLAYAQATLGIAAILVGGTIAIAAFAGDQSISEGVLNTLSITDWQTGVRAGASTLATLGTGTVARRIGTTMVVRNLNVGGRIGTVAIAHLGMLFLLMWLVNIVLEQVL